MFDNQHEVTAVLPLGCDVSAMATGLHAVTQGGKHSSEGLSPALLLPSPAADSALSLWLCPSRARNARQNTMSAGGTASGDPGCSLRCLGPLQCHRLSPESSHSCLDVLRDGSGKSGF